MELAPDAVLRAGLPAKARRAGLLAVGALAALAAMAGIGTLVALAPHPSLQESAPGPAGSFGENPAWDDGKAELSIYAAEEIVEGETRRFEARSIVVAEHFDAKQMVKKEEFDLGCVPVLKCNWILDIPAGAYRYQQMASLFLRRSDALVMKAVFASQEWCGATFQEWRRDQRGLHVHSYWDGEGDRTWELPELGASALFYEQVPLWIRSRRPEHVRTEPITLIKKRLATSRCPPPTPHAAAIFFDGVKEEGAARRVVARLLLDKHEDRFLLAPEFPYTLIEWQRGDGTVWKLKESRRVAYWEK